MLAQALSVDPSHSATLNGHHGTMASATDGGPVRLTTISPTAVLQAYDAEELMQAILDELLANADVNVGLAFSLTTQLENVLTSLDRKNPTAATNMLQGFIDQIEDLTQTGRLRSTDGRLLIDAAQSVIDQLNG